MLLLFHLNTKTIDKMSVEFAFVSYFEIEISTDNFSHVLHCMCLR